MQHLWNPILKHNYREQNRVADLLAKEWAKKNFFEKPLIFAVSSVFANEVVWSDILGTAFERHVIACNINTTTNNTPSRQGPISTQLLTLVLDNSFIYIFMFNKKKSMKNFSGFYDILLHRVLYSEKGKKYTYYLGYIL